MSTEKKEAPEVTQHEAMIAMSHLRSFVSYVDGRHTIRKKSRKPLKWSMETLTKFIGQQDQ